MSTDSALLDQYSQREYKHGFVTEIEADSIPPGLNEDVVRLIPQHCLQLLATGAIHLLFLPKSVDLKWGRITSQQSEACHGTLPRHR